MFATFSQCENLTDLNITIPESVTNLQYTFGNCLKLSGVIEVNANVTGQLINDKLDYNCSYHFEQIKKRHICLAERCVVYPFYVVTAFLRLSFPIFIILKYQMFVKFFRNI